MELSRDREYLVTENQNLVRYIIITKMGIPMNHPEFEDLNSIGTIGLMKAAITFDEGRNIKFSSYAFKCITNELRMHFRKNDRKHSSIVSINDNIFGIEELTIEDTIEDICSRFEDKIVDKDTFTIAMNYLLNCFSGKTRLVMLYYMGGLKQFEIAQKLNLSQSFVSRILSQTSSKRLINFIDEKKQYREVYQMSMQGESYKLTFFSKDIQHFNHIFASFLSKVASAEEIPDFEVLCNKERIIIKVQEHPRAFLFIAQIIQEIDEYGLKFVSSNDLPYKGKEYFKSQSEVQEIAEKNKVQEVMPKPDTQEEVKKTTSQFIRNHSSSKAAIVRNYFLNFSDCFSVNDIMKKFPEMDVGTIRFALQSAKKRGLIVNLQRGIYKVNR